MRIQDLLTMTEAQCFNYITAQLPSPIVNQDNFIYQQGDPASTIMLVSHMDTVSNPSSLKDLCFSKCGNVITSLANTCLGADDRAGVYAMLKIYKNAKIKPHLLFTCKEERGGVGATAFTKETDLINDLSSKLYLMIELDRKGASEYVTYDMTLDRELEEWIEGFGFISSHGSYSDIATIGPYVKVPSVNLSIGYYAQHTHGERLHVDEMEMTISRVLQMLTSPPPKTEYHEFKWSGYSWRDTDDLAWLNDWGQRDLTKGMEELDTSCELIESLISKDCLCDECSAHWTECECGRMADIIEDYLTLSEIEALWTEIPEAKVLETLDYSVWYGKGAV